MNKTLYNPAGVIDWETQLVEQKPLYWTSEEDKINLVQILIKLIMGILCVLIWQPENNYPFLYSYSVLGKAVYFLKYAKTLDKTYVCVHGNPYEIFKDNTENICKLTRKLPRVCLGLGKIQSG